MITGVLFYAFAAVLIVAAVGVITTRNPVHSALFLVLAFVQSAALWLLAEAEFLAIALVLVYVGAVMVLFLFVVMMLDINTEELRKGFTRYLPLGVIVALVVVVEIAHVIWFKSQGLKFLTTPQPNPPDYSNTKALGQVLYTQHVYAFEIASVILLVGIIAAVMLTLRRRTDTKHLDISKQLAVKASQRLRIVKMRSEKEAPAEEAK